MVTPAASAIASTQAAFGWARAAVSAINSAGLIGIALGGIAMGFLAERLPVRRVCLLGAVSLSAALLAAAQARTLWQFYLLFFLAGTLGGGGR